MCLLENAARALPTPEGARGRRAYALATAETTSDQSPT
jgi:hypothetical protein